VSLADVVTATALPIGCALVLIAIPLIGLRLRPQTKSKAGKALYVVVAVGWSVLAAYWAAQSDWLLALLAAVSAVGSVISMTLPNRSRKVPPPSTGTSA
jgi:hypothetical protein